MNIVKFRVRELSIPGYPEQTQLQLQMSLRCPHCGDVKEHVLATKSDIWRWGLDSNIEMKAKGLLTREALLIRPRVAVTRVFYCGECGMGSVITDGDLRVFIGQLYTAVGHLPEGFGEPWALAKLDNFMVKHLKHEEELWTGSSDHCFHVTHGYRYNEFLLKLCPCKLCEREREREFEHTQLVPKHFDLARFRAPQEQLEVFCSP